MLKLWRPYLLSVGTMEPRKNYEFLIRTFEAMDAYEGDLVIAGLRGWKFEPVLKRLKESPRAARIHCLEYVDEALLCRAADALAAHEELPLQAAELVAAAYCFGEAGCALAVVPEYYA